MSSVTRFLRQIQPGMGLVNDQSFDQALDFVPTSGNYVGNYPPGYMVPAAATGLASAIANAQQSAGVQVVRDMGKTIYCPSASQVGGAVTQAGFFRQYQLLVVNPISLSQGFIGGPSGNTFGVVGPSAPTLPGTSTYVTFYLPVAVAGVGGPGNLLSLADVNVGGQM